MRHLIHSLTRFFVSMIKKTSLGKKIPQDYAGVPVDKLRRLAKQNEHRWLRLPNGTFLRYVSRREVLVRHMDGSIFQLHYDHSSRITSRLVNPTADQLMQAAQYQSIGTKMSISPESVLTSKRSS